MENLTVSKLTVLGLSGGLIRELFEMHGIRKRRAERTACDQIKPRALSTPAEDSSEKINGLQNYSTDTTDQGGPNLKQWKSDSLLLLLIIAVNHILKCFHRNGY